MPRINMIGQPCPLPVIEAKKALKGAAVGQSVAILVDNDVARQNLAKMALGLGHEIRHELTAEGHILVTITAAAEGRPLGGDDSGLVLAVGRAVLGAGDDELGAALMKSFIYSLTELETAPEQILFFNGGVRLTTEGSTALEDLADLAAKGTLINSCGACLNFYGLTDKLKIGSITNMFAIVSTLAQAKKLISL